MSSTITEFYRARGPTKAQLDAIERATRRNYQPSMSCLKCGKIAGEAIAYCDEYECPHV